MTKNDRGQAKIGANLGRLSTLGPETRAQATELMKLLEHQPLHTQSWTVEAQGDLVQALLWTDWSDQSAARVLAELAKRFGENPPSWHLHDLVIWLRAHPDDAEAVIECMRVDPPQDVSILRLMSQVGSQKVVFAAKWHLTLGDIVVKRFVDKDGAEHLLSREMFANPLGGSHPNVIETHLLHNRSNDPFLVERRLQSALSDSWSSDGLQEAANLLRDIAAALEFVSNRGYVHGDVKPDNIGFDNDRYILLDFGICRLASSFGEAATPTGSLRTRAPEVLVGECTHSNASDIWALGATVYNSIKGRFPLFKPNEPVPRVSNPRARSSMEEKLARRVRQEWETWVDVSSVSDPMGSLLAELLARDPAKRPTASAVLQRAQRDLAALLRPHQGEETPLSPIDEIRQLERCLQPGSGLAAMPESKRRQLMSRLDRLEQAAGLADDLPDIINKLRTRVA